MAGNAGPGVDYTLSGVPGQVTIPAGQTSADVVMHSIADHVKERPESASMILGAGSGYKVPKRSKAVVKIINTP